MCGHDDTKKRVIERAREDGDDGRYTRQGEQLLECRVCGDTSIAYPARR